MKFAFLLTWTLGVNIKHNQHDCSNHVNMATMVVANMLCFSQGPVQQFSMKFTGEWSDSFHKATHVADMDRRSR